MNKWECQHKGCRNSCVGVGGAIGLRAIGWYFELGPVILCPAHRPDGINGNGKYLECKIKNCPQCKGTEKAEWWQDMIRKVEGEFENGK